MIVDTSVLLAVFFNEKHGHWCLERLNANRGSLCMSTVNLAETFIHLRDRQPVLADSLREKILASDIRFVPPTPEHAEIAAKARAEFPLNLGDCFAYALARTEKKPILTLDKDFKKSDVKVVMP